MHTRRIFDRWQESKNHTSMHFLCDRDEKNIFFSVVYACAWSVFVFPLFHTVPTRFCRPLYLSDLAMLDDAIRWNRYDSNNLFAKHCNPSLIVSRTRCLSRVQTFVIGERLETIRVIRSRHTVLSVMYRMEKARYFKFIFRFSHATVNRNHSQL